jgi:hypothetical protein
MHAVGMPRDPDSEPEVFNLDYLADDMRQQAALLRRKGQVAEADVLLNKAQYRKRFDPRTLPFDPSLSCKWSPEGSGSSRTTRKSAWAAIQPSAAAARCLLSRGVRRKTPSCESQTPCSDVAGKSALHTCEQPHEKADPAR